MKRYLFRTILGRKREGKRKKGGRDKGRKEKSQELDVLIYVITNECESGQVIYLHSDFLKDLKIF